jgi:hypothetical protein
MPSSPTYSSSSGTLCNIKGGISVDGFLNGKTGMQGIILGYFDTRKHTSTYKNTRSRRATDLVAGELWLTEFLWARGKKTTGIEAM